MAMTVTVTQTGGTYNIALAVRVVTGQAGSPIGAVVQSSVNGGLSEPITPTGSNSLVYGALQTTQDNTSYPSPVLASTTVLSDSVDSTGYGAEGMTFKNAAATAAGTPVTLGFPNTNRAGFYAILAMLEILSGGSLAEDASTPAVVLPSGISNFTGALSRTTASFSPAGSLLVAIVTARTSNPAQTLTMTDSAGLTWTSQAYKWTTGSGLVQIFTAPVPGGGGTDAAVTPSVLAVSAAFPAVTISGSVSVLVLPACLAVAARFFTPAVQSSVWGRSRVSGGLAGGSTVGGQD